MKNIAHILRMFKRNLEPKLAISNNFYPTEIKKQRSNFRYQTKGHVSVLVIVTSINIGIIYSPQLCNELATISTCNNIKENP